VVGRRRPPNEGSNYYWSVDLLKTTRYRAVFLAKGPEIRTPAGNIHEGYLTKTSISPGHFIPAGAETIVAIPLPVDINRITEECGPVFIACRHDECDLHTTTNIVATALNNQCTVPWIAPGQVPAPKCCTSDLTLSQFKSLRGKMDASNPNGLTAADYLGGTPSWRTDLYTGRGTLMTLKESIELNETNGVKHTPELKAGDPARIKATFGGQEQYAQKMIDELKAAGVNPKDVCAQSFNPDDVVYWIQHEPRFGKQAVYLDDIDPTATGSAIVLSGTSASEGARRKDHRSAFAGIAVRERIGRNRSVRLRHDDQVDGIRHHHLDVRASRPSPRRRDRWFLLLLRSAGRCGEEGQRYVQSSRRACQAGRNPRYFFRLARNRHLLRELHGLKVGSAMTSGA